MVRSDWTGLPFTVGVPAADGVVPPPNEVELIAEIFAAVLTAGRTRTIGDVGLIGKIEDVFVREQIDNMAQY
jgi:hypothetical protein